MMRDIIALTVLFVCLGAHICFNEFSIQRLNALQSNKTIGNAAVRLIYKAPPSPQCSDSPLNAAGSDDTLRDYNNVMNLILELEIYAQTPEHWKKTEELIRTEETALLSNGSVIWSKLKTVIDAHVNTTNNASWFKNKSINHKYEDFPLDGFDMVLGFRYMNTLLVKQNVCNIDWDWEALSV